MNLRPKWVGACDTTGRIDTLTTIPYVAAAVAIRVWAIVVVVAAAAAKRKAPYIIAVYGANR